MSRSLLRYQTKRCCQRAAGLPGEKPSTLNSSVGSLPVTGRATTTINPSPF